MKKTDCFGRQNKLFCLTKQSVFRCFSPYLGWFYKLALLDFELIFEVKMQESEGVDVYKRQAYYFQGGAIQNGLKYDKQTKEAIRLLKSKEEYNQILSGAKGVTNKGTQNKH